MSELIVFFIWLAAVGAFNWLFQRNPKPPKYWNGIEVRETLKELDNRIIVVRDSLDSVLYERYYRKDTAVREGTELLLRRDSSRSEGSVQEVYDGCND